MKKLNLFLLIFLTAGVLSNFIFSGCGGGGTGTGIVEPQATFTATVIAVTTTPTITTTPVASVTSTAVVSATVVVTSTTKPTATSAPTAPSVSGKVTNMFSGSPVSGAIVTLGGASASTDIQGNFSIIGSSGRMEISGSGYYTYSFPVTSASLEVFLVGTDDMNNVSYSSYFIRGNSKRWLKIPKFRINENITAAQAAVIKNIIISELPGLTGGFMKITESEIMSTIETEPEQGEVVISMDSTATNSFAELSYSTNEIVAVKIVLRDEDLSLNEYSWRTIRHELGHMIGLNHPFDNLGWDSTDLPISVMNYVNDEKKYSLTFSDFDKKTGTRKYNRAAGSFLEGNIEKDPDLPVVLKKIIITKEILY